MKMLNVKGFSELIEKYQNQNETEKKLAFNTKKQK